MATKNKQKLKANMVAWRERNPVRAMVCYAKAGAKQRGIPFTITWQDLGEVPAVCPVLGIPLVRSSDCQSPNNPSLDRVDNRYGYVLGNVHIISYRANVLKSNATADELRRILAYMEEYDVV